MVEVERIPQPQPAVRATCVCGGWGVGEVHLWHQQQTGHFALLELRSDWKSTPTCEPMQAIRRRRDGRDRALRGKSVEHAERCRWKEKGQVSPSRINTGQRESWQREKRGLVK